MIHEEDHCRLGDRGDCGGPHAQANFTDVSDDRRSRYDPPKPTAFTGATVTSNTYDRTEGGEPRIKIYLNWDGQDHFHQLVLAGDGLRYLAELLARMYGVTLPSDVSDLKRDYYAGQTHEQIVDAGHELIRRGVITRIDPDDVSDAYEG